MAKRDSIPDLGVYLWNGYGVVSALLQDIISIYPFFNNPNYLTVRMVSRVCNAMGLLKYIAENRQTKHDFVSGKNSK